MTQQQAPQQQQQQQQQQQAPQRLAGGSAGITRMEEASSFSGDYTGLSLFKDSQVRPLSLSGKSPLSGVILPAFDASLPVFDQARPMSVAPYRETFTEVKGAKDFAFSPWFYPYLAYTFIGEKKNGFFFSPEMFGAIDPITKLRIKIYSDAKKTGDQSLLYLVKSPSKEVTAPLPSAQSGIMMNIYAVTNNSKDDDKSLRNHILMLGATARDTLFEQLNTDNPGYLTQPRDANYPTYMFGDVTNPGSALSFLTASRPTQNGGIANIIKFGEVQRDANNQHFLACNPVTVPYEALVGRYDLGSMDTLRQPTYNEVVEFLVKDHRIPYNLLVTVLSDLYQGDFPLRTEDAGSINTQAPQGYQQPQQQWQQPAPQQAMPAYQQPQQQQWQPQQVPAAQSYQPQPQQQQQWQPQQQQQQWQPQQQQQWQQPQQPQQPQQQQWQQPVMHQEVPASQETAPTSTMPQYQSQVTSTYPTQPQQPQSEPCKPVDDVPMDYSAPQTTEYPQPAQSPSSEASTRTPEEEELYQKLRTKVTTEGPSCTPEEIRQFTSLHNK